jgi:general L-amino acid transport system permease protein
MMARLVALLTPPPGRRRAWLLQLMLVLAIAAAAAVMWHNARQNLAAQSIGSGFGFLDRAAGFDVGQALVDFPPDASYRRVLLVGLLNTAAVSISAAGLATILGVLVAVLSLSANAGMRTLARAYVEAMRNLPPLFHVFFWYVVVLRSLPAARESWHLGEAVFLNIQGLYLPRWTGAGFEYPVLDGFGFAGGLRLVPEFFVLTLALSLYTAGFLAEILRAGILSVARGQREAACALGLTERQALRFVVLPQALRLAVPPATSQYLNLLKNSSLAVAIGYPDMTAVFAGITLNQTGQAIEVLAITMGCYLAMSVLTAVVLNAYNRRVALRGDAP